LGTIVDCRVKGPSGLLEFADSDAATRALLYHDSIYYERCLSVQPYETAGVTLQDVNLASEQRRLLDQVAATRERLSGTQKSIRVASTDVDGGLPLPPAFIAFIAARDAARRAHYEQLTCTVREGELQQSRDTELQAESAALLEQAALSPADAQRLDALQTHLLPALGELAQMLPRLCEELRTLQPHVDGALPETAHLHALHAAWEAALDELHDARHEETRRRPKPDAAQHTHAARGRLQAAEAQLRHERARLWQAATHFPEVLAHEPLLRLGAVEGDTFQRVLVQRELDQYCGPDGAAELHVLASHLCARHRIFRAEFGNDGAGRALPCVLKEYELDGKGGEWRRLVAEVEALSKLSHAHIVEVQAVFQPERPPTPSPVAYVQVLA
jgi:hypothetical protein